MFPCFSHGSYFDSNLTNFNTEKLFPLKVRKAVATRLGSSL